MDYCRVIIASVVLLLPSDSYSFDMNASKSPDTAVMGISSPKFSLTCSYTLGTGETFISLSLRRKRSDDTEFKEIITYPGPTLPQNVSYSEDGQLLESRTTVTRPTEENQSAVLTFDEIQCSDKAEYKWVGSYLTTSLQSKERTITFNIQAKSKFFNDGVISFTPNINIAEGDRITFSCEGDVGAEPTGSIAWYYYLDNSENGILIGDSVSESPVFNSTSCSNHRRSTMSMTMTKEFNRIVVRCTAQQTKYDLMGDGHIQTSQIPVFSRANECVYNNPDQCSVMCPAGKRKACEHGICTCSRTCTLRDDCDACPTYTDSMGHVHHEQVHCINGACLCQPDGPMPGGVGPVGR